MTREIIHNERQRGHERVLCGGWFYKNLETARLKPLFHKNLPTENLLHSIDVCHQTNPFFNAKNSPFK